MEFWLWTLAICVMLCLAGGVIGLIHIFGYGRVPSQAQGLEKQLSEQVVYELVSSTQDGADCILLVKEFGSSNYRAIRTNTIPPKIFALFDGQPVEVKK